MNCKHHTWMALVLCEFACAFSTFVTKDLEHSIMSQMKGRSSLWITEWVFKLTLVVKAFSHILQENGGNFYFYNVMPSQVYFQISFLLERMFTNSTLKRSIITVAILNMSSQIPSLRKRHWAFITFKIFSLLMYV